MGSKYSPRLTDDITDFDVAGNVGHHDIQRLLTGLSWAQSKSNPIDFHFKMHSNKNDLAFNLQA